jgi:hypothetical protein
LALERGQAALPDLRINGFEPSLGIAEFSIEQFQTPNATGGTKRIN